MMFPGSNTKPVGDRVEVKDVKVMMSLLRAGYFVQLFHEEDGRTYMQILEPAEDKENDDSSPKS